MATAYIGTIKAGKVELTAPLTLPPEGSDVFITLTTLLDKATARRRANVWLLEQVGNAISKNGTLIHIDRKAIWRFEVFLTVPHHAPLGPMGQVDVDALTGQILNSPNSAEVMITHGRHLTVTS